RHRGAPGAVRGIDARSFGARPSVLDRGGPGTAAAAADGGERVPPAAHDAFASRAAADHVHDECRDAVLLLQSAVGAGVVLDGDESAHGLAAVARHAPGSLRGCRGTGVSVSGWAKNLEARSRLGQADALNEAGARAGRGPIRARTGVRAARIAAAPQRAGPGPRGV